MKKSIIPILVSVWLFSVPCGFAQSAPAADRNLVVADAVAEVSGGNDSVAVSIAVVTRGINLEQVARENDAKTRVVLKSIKDLNLENLKFKTVGYRVSPQRNYKVRPPKIEGYEVSDMVEVVLEGMTPEQLSRHVSDIFGLALQNGANNIESVRFYIQHRESLENQALKQATRQAIERAHTLAAAAGVKLGRLVSLSTGAAQVKPQLDLLRAAEIRTAAAPPIESGESRIRVQVAVAYEIE